MIPTRIGELAKAAGGRVIPERMADAYVRSVEIDSRKIMLGSLFIPIIGERVDGHDFIEKAFSQGATCALIREDHLMAHEDQLPYCKALIVVQDTEAALEDMAAWYRSCFPIPIVGVTGSVGKTSCKDFVAAALSGGRKVLKTLGNHNNNIGMPLTLFELDETYEAAVTEMGMDHFGEITRLSRTARPKVGIITNIGISHMENLGSREGILKAKLEITDYLDPEGILFLNGDDERLYGLKGKRPETIEYFGWQEACEGRILAAESLPDGRLYFKGTYHGETYETVLHTPARHMAYNIMPAIMSACFLGLTKEEILRGLDSYESADGRMHVLNGAGCTVIDDCYNASPDSMTAALETLAAWPGSGRHFAILGDMFELGAMEEEGHRAVGRVVAEKSGIDVLWTVGTRARWIQEEASRSAAVCRHFDTVEDLIEALAGEVRTQDVILVKASHGMALERIVRTLTETK
ncbi:MAG: UDP-N-acetylmuramoyl-tripeptide--D-alanyl-D-alanine ligase [Clostridiales bacterium]|nr:UDP-N-acetylmuramoyl-tripeptide--D-alanyl-D-alanine ligase [Clostridiales bacterium]